MSTSIALVTCAEVSSERRMCSEMPRRIAVTGSSASPACSSAAGAGAGGGLRRRGSGSGRLGRPAAGCASGCGGAGAGAAGATAASGSGACGVAGWAWAPLSMKPRMSFFVTRPPAPVPGHLTGVDAVLGGNPRDDR